MGRACAQSKPSARRDSEGRSGLNQQVTGSQKHGADSPAEHLEPRVKVPKQTSTRALVPIRDSGIQAGHRGDGPSLPQRHRGLSSEPQERGVACLGTTGRRLPSHFWGPRQPPSDPLAPGPATSRRLQGPLTV